MRCQTNVIVGETKIVAALKQDDARHWIEFGREGRFLVGPHPRVPGVTVVSACSGHGFKHSAGLGEAIAAEVLGETPFCDLGPFRVGR